MAREIPEIVPLVVDAAVARNLEEIKKNLNNSVVNNKITLSLLKDEFGGFFRGELTNDVDINYATANWLRVAGGEHGSVDILDDITEECILTVPPLLNSYKQLPIDKVHLAQEVRDQKLQGSRMRVLGEDKARAIVAKLTDKLEPEEIDFDSVRALVSGHDITNTMTINDDTGLQFD